MFVYLINILQTVCLLLRLLITLITFIGIIKINGIKNIAH